MKKNINVEVNSIRLEENTETPIMLLLDPNSQKVLPIWIGTIEAVSIAYAQEGIKHPRPQTHDLIIDIIESLNGNIDEVVISDLHDNTYFAEIIILGDQGRVSLSARPSDAIALALRADTTISVNEDLFLNNSIDLIHDKANEIEEFKSFIENINPEEKHISDIEISEALDELESVNAYLYSIEALMERIFDTKISNNIELKFKEIAKELAPDPLNVDRLVLNRLFHQTPDLPDKNNIN